MRIVAEMKYVGLHNGVSSSGLQIMTHITCDDRWNTMSYMRMYTLFRNPLSIKSPLFGVLLNKPRCVRKLSKAARGKGVYAMDEG